MLTCHRCQCQPSVRTTVYFTIFALDIVIFIDELIILSKRENDYKSQVAGRKLSEFNFELCSDFRQFCTVILLSVVYF